MVCLLVVAIGLRHEKSGIGGTRKQHRPLIIGHGGQVYQDDFMVGAKLSDQFREPFPLDLLTRCDNVDPRPMIVIEGGAR